MPINFATGIAIFSVYITAAIIYAVMYYINRRKGVDPRLAFKEIPPE